MGNQSMCTRVLAVTIGEGVNHCGDSSSTQWLKLMGINQWRLVAIKLVIRSKLAALRISTGAVMIHCRDP